MLGSGQNRLASNPGDSKPALPIRLVSHMVSLVAFGHRRRDFSLWYTRNHTQIDSFLAGPEGAP